MARTVYTQFKTGDEVAIARGVSSRTYEYRTVRFIKGSAVVLDDGSQWTQKGRAYGAGMNNYSVFAPSLIKAKDARGYEASQAARDAEMKMGATWRAHLENLRSIRCDDDDGRRKALDAAEKVVAWLRQVRDTVDVPAAIAADAARKAAAYAAAPADAMRRLVVWDVDTDPVADGGGSKCIVWIAESSEGDAALRAAAAAEGYTENPPHRIYTFELVQQEGR